MARSSPPRHGYAMNPPGPKRIAILTSGGPAPGINSVINAATLEAINLGWEVYGVRQGFGGLLRDRVQRLHIPDVAWIHTQGGSALGVSRTHPAQDGDLEPSLRTLRRHGIDGLITIGGDGTAAGAAAISQAMGDDFQVVHVPKTIDNDLPLPQGVPTFGFTTARHLGVELVHNLMRDAQSSRRWYAVVAMGRQAGHLALGIGKAAGATLTLIPEEFDGPISLEHLVDLVDGSVLKGLAHDRPWGVAILAEGLVHCLEPTELERFSSIKRDSQGRIRLSNLELGVLISEQLNQRLSARRESLQFNEIKLGYELRCAKPVPFDIEYTRDLGYAATRFLAEGGSDAMVLIDRGRRTFMTFDEMRDPDSGDTQLRLVDTSSESYLVARRYMQRLTASDFNDTEELERLAGLADMSPDAFVDHYAYLVADEPDVFAWRAPVRNQLPPS